MRTTITALVLAALPAVAVVGAPAAAGEPTCHGETATHVGTPGELLITTPGPDVVVSNGARAVRSLNGDDVICVTGPTGDSTITIVPGGGDDLVDTRTLDQGYLTTFLGAIGVDGSSGDDVYVGGPADDGVRLASGTPGDEKQIRTGTGGDYVTMYDDYPGDVTATLGSGKDSAIVYQRAGVEVDAGLGIDQLTAYCKGCDTGSFDLRNGQVDLDGAPAGEAAGFEHLEFDRAGLGLARRATVIGNNAANRIVTFSCHADLRGGPGDDDIYAFGQRSRCNGTGSEIAGGPGSDYLWGSDGPDAIRGLAGRDDMYGNGGDDVLRGGDGNDIARGGPGHDRCQAESARRCES